MSRRDVTVPATSLLTEGIFYWSSLKIDSLVFTYKNINSVYKTTFKDKINRREKEIIRAQIKMEIVVTAVHCAEILASYLLAFEKQGKAIQRSLFKYQVSDVNKFYSSIRRKGVPYIAKIFSYPQPSQVEDQNIKRKIRRACDKIKKELADIGKYYSQNLDMYNSYKHGMRISAFSSEEENSKDYHGIIGYLTPDKSFYPAKVTLIRIDHKKAVKLSLKMTSLLLNCTQNYLNRTINGEKESVILH